MTSQEGGLAYDTTLTPPFIIKVHLPSYEHLTRVCSVPDEGYSKNIIVRKLRYQRFCYFSPIGEIIKRKKNTHTGKILMSYTFVDSKRYTRICIRCGDSRS
jgi:hypothetical protein